MFATFTFSSVVLKGEIIILKLLSYSKKQNQKNEHY